MRSRRQTKDALHVVEPRQTTTSDSPGANAPASVIKELLRALVVAEAVIAGYVIVLLRDGIIPPHFLWDGYLIQRVARGAEQADIKYTNTAAVYAWLGLADNPVLASLLGYTGAVVATLIVWIRLRHLHSSWPMVMLVVVTLLLSAVYLAWYSKDVLVIPITLAILLLPSSRVGWAIGVAAMVVYAYLFRDYWYLVALAYVGIRLVAQRLNWARAIALGMLTTIAISVSMVLFLGVDADNFRTSVNDARAFVDVGTLISPFVSLPEPAGGIVNNTITYFALLVPVPLVALGSLYYLGIAAVVGAIWIAFFSSLRPNPHPTTRRALALVLAFVSVQAVFEPDYGSALRHLTPLLPLILWVVWTSASARVGHPLVLEPVRKIQDRAADGVFCRLPGKRFLFACQTFGVNKKSLCPRCESHMFLTASIDAPGKTSPSGEV